MPPRAQPVTVTWLGGIGLFTLLLFGLLAFWAALFLQSCVEGSARMGEARAQALAAVAPHGIPSDAIDRRNDGKVVHLTGHLRLQEPLRDPDFGVAAEALVLERRVQVFRREGNTVSWREQPMQPENDDGGEQPPNRPSRPNSARFEVPDRHLRLGAFSLYNVTLPEELTQAMRPLPLSAAALQSLPEPLRARARISGDEIQVGSVSDPAVGDLRIRYRAAPLPEEVSVIAGHGLWGLSPHSIADGSALFVMKAGRHSARALLPAPPAQSAMSSAHILTLPLFVMGMFLVYWPLRAVSRAAPPLRVFVDAGAVLFLALGTVAALTAGVAYTRWRQNAPGVGFPATISVAAFALLVFLGVRRRQGLGASAAGEPDWYYMMNGSAVGPVSLAELVQAVPGRLPLDTVVWSPWTTGWVPAAEVPALQAAGYWSARRKAEGPGFLKLYFLWFVVLIEDALQLGRRLGDKRDFTRLEYLGTTFLAGMVAFFFLLGAVEVTDLETAQGNAAAVRTASVLFAVLGLVLPAVFMIRASACRLRDLGQSERRSLLMLVPGLNFLLWFQLITEAGASEKPPPAP